MTHAKLDQEFLESINDDNVDQFLQQEADSFVARKLKKYWATN